MKRFICEYQDGGFRDTLMAMQTVSLVRIEGALFASATARPSGQAIVDGERTCDYAGLARAACGLAAELRDRGVSPGDRVGIFFDKSLEAVVAFYGTWAAGGVAVPINEGLRSNQVGHILRDSGARLLLSTPRKLAGIEASAYEGVPTAEVDVVALERASLAPLDNLPSGTREPAAILYTSGSTGLPKGILISHANLLAGTRIVVKYLELQPDERILSVLPFSFDYGLNQLLTAVDRGATLVLQRSHFPPDICRALETHRHHGPRRRADAVDPAHAAALAVRPALVPGAPLHHELRRRVPRRAGPPLSRAPAAHPRLSHVRAVRGVSLDLPSARGARSAYRPRWARRSRRPTSWSSTKPAGHATPSRSASSCTPGPPCRSATGTAPTPPRRCSVPTRATATTTPRWSSTPATSSNGTPMAFSTSSGGATSRSRATGFASARRRSRRPCTARRCSPRSSCAACRTMWRGW